MELGGRSMVKRYGPYLLIVSLVVSLAVPLWVGGFDAKAVFERLPLWAIPVLPGMIVLGWAFNAVRIRYLAAALGLRLSPLVAMQTVMSAEFAGMATPANAGWPATYIWLLGRRGLGVPEAGALVVLDQMIDLAFFAAAVPAALLASLGTVGTRWWPVAVALPFAGVALLFLTPRYYRPVALAVGRLLRRWERLRRFRWRLARWLLRFRASVRLLLSMPRRQLVLVYLACGAHWAMRYGVLPLTFWALGDPISWSYLFLVQSITLFVGHLSMLPGGTGGVEVSFGVLLGPFVGADVLGATLLIWRFCTFYWYLVAGAPVFLYTAGRAAVSRLA